MLVEFPAMLLRETFPAGPFACNCSVIACGDTKDAVVVDPGGETKKIAEIVAHYDLTVVAIIHTHAHLDHIWCTRDVKETHGGDICLHKDDLPLYRGLAAQAAMFGWSPREPTEVDRFIDDGESIAFGKRSFEVIHTPGHTPGSVCFQLTYDKKPLLLSGDTLFRRSVGRTDLPGGDTKTLMASIRSRLYTLDPEAVVVPGHGPNTTIAEEAAKNPFVTAS